MWVGYLGGAYESDFGVDDWGSKTDDTKLEIGKRWATECRDKCYENYGSYIKGTPINEREGEWPYVEWECDFS